MVYLGANTILGSNFGINPNLIGIDRDPTSLFRILYLKNNMISWMQYLIPSMQTKSRNTLPKNTFYSIIESIALL